MRCKRIGIFARIIRRIRERKGVFVPTGIAARIAKREGEREHRRNIEAIQQRAALRELRGY